MADKVGGYDEGYSACSCFWGREPGRMVKRLFEAIPEVRGLRVLDVGCGEGKNAHALASMGARVIALDCSALALRNARAAWPKDPIEWVEADVREVRWPANTFDVVVAYGLFHCLPNRSDVENVVSRLQSATEIGGRHVVCAFNCRQQDFRGAHRGFEPCLLSHDEYLAFYAGWSVEQSSDEDLEETHPHDAIAHRHSLTRLIARKLIR
jgi:ubiquinone/menaquinone biosynthesis C-methylase UbiE